MGRVGLLVVACLMALASLAGNASAAQLPVGLGSADTFAVLAGSTVTNTGFSTLNGDLGVSPGTAFTGFPPGTVNGAKHSADMVAAQAQADLTIAYNDAAGRTPPIALPADVGGRTLTPGVYRSDAALGLTGTLTLDGQGDPNAVFVFQVGSALTTAVSSQVSLVNGAQPSNVVWQIGSSATLGTSSVFAGTIMALSSISINDGVTLTGRALARNGAVTLINDTITVPQLIGGGTAGPTGPTPTPTPTPTGPTGPGPTSPTGSGSTASCITSQTAKRRPARPVLRSPRAGGHVRAGLVRFRWRPAARAARYTLVVDQHRVDTRCATKAAMRVRAGSHSYRVIARNRFGARSSTERAFSAKSDQGVNAEKIRSDQGLKELERYANDARNHVKPSLLARAKPLLRSLTKLGKAVSAGVVLELVRQLIEPSSTSCYEQPKTTTAVNALARRAFRPASRALRAAGRARRGRTSGPRRRLQQALKALGNLGIRLDGFFESNQDEDCQAYAKVAKSGLAPAKEAVQRSLTYLDGIDRDTARRKAKTISRRKRVGKVRCKEAGKLGDELPKGPGERNYVVYWSPPALSPPGRNVRYVGISRSLKRRCQAHPDERSRNLETLNLPRLSYPEAKQVEEALIAHFGPGQERDNDDTRDGQLRNKIHAIRPVRNPAYCPRLLAGQSLLLVTGYGPYTGASFTRRTKCLGVGRS